MQRGKTQKIALSGIIIAIIILCLFGGTIIRNNKIFFIALAIIIGVIPYMNGGVKHGLTAYLASSFLAFILVPNKLYVGVYIIFGIYPLIKILSERMKVLPQYFIKYLWFNSSVILTYILIYIIFGYPIVINNFFVTIPGIAILIIAGQVFFFGFDYFFDICINYIHRRLKGVINNGH